MIIVQLSGGLGNQLFQYALGRKLSIKNKTDLFLYIGNLKEHSTKRSMCLDKLNIDCKTTNQTSNARVYKEKFFHYDPLIPLIRNNVFLKGYWQSEKYFRDIRHILLNEITPKNKLHSSFHEVDEHILNSESVSIHIRRGDYLSKRNLEFHGVCSPEYYFKSIKYIMDVTGNKNLSFFVFSDDIKWARENIRDSNLSINYVSKDNSDFFTDEFFLMSKCKHNIISNSTFSWWAAWINQYSKKIVIAPSKWFTDIKIVTKDLIPNTWIRL